MKKFKPIQVDAELQEQFKIACAMQGEFMCDVLKPFMIQYVKEVKNGNTGGTQKKVANNDT